MKTLTKIFATAAICALPLMASAQTTTPTDNSSSGKVLAPDQPRSESERKATQENGQAPNYGQTDSRVTDPGYSDTGRSKTRTKRTDKVTRDSQPASGDSPSYPAKTKDGRPTGDSDVKSTPAN